MILLAAMASAFAVPQAAVPQGFKGNLTMSIEFQPPDAPTASSPDGALTIVARRTYRAKMSTRTDKTTRVRQCTLRQPFGIAPIDAGLCGQLLDCMTRSPTRALVKACMLQRLVSDLRTHFGIPAS